jgi:LysM repeat protein
MSRLGVSFRLVLALATCLGVGGCFPSARSTSDEQREPHFLAGKARANALDYKGAIEAFEKALEANPRNASAHFELALLCEKDETDLAGAIYHFDRYLRLRPNAENADIVKDRLLRCKQVLASGVLPVSPTPNMQHDLERLTAENRELRRQLEAWQAYYASHPQPASNAAIAPTIRTSAGASPVAAPSSQPVQSAPAARTHTVKAGESPYSIAKKYGVKLDALLAANPNVNPKRLKVGQTLNIPEP